MESLTKKLALIIFLFLFLPLFVKADYTGQTVIFSIDSSYDLEKRENTSAILQKISSKAYFYIDDKWWQGLDSIQKSKIMSALDSLSSEFDSKIYPNLTSTFGSEANPGIDNDPRITILIHPMSENAGGYFNSGDEYSKIQNPKSNQREMIYLNSNFIDTPNEKSYLAHELVHLITFNQKDKIYNISEETWLNETRADYAPTLLGYDDVYAGSNLEKRVKNLLEKPNDSLTEWREQNQDYGEVNLFAQYLVDQYGLKILADSLHSPKIGILSINEALVESGFKEDFSQIFADWTITLLINDCNLGGRYCYKNPNLKNLKINPLLNFLPLGGDSSLSINFTTKNWSGNWQKIIGGGNGTLALDFDGDNEVSFRVPYLLCDKAGKCQINFLKLDKDQKGEITVPDFSVNYSSLTIMPLIQSKFLGFDGPDRSYIFSWKVSVVKTDAEKEAELEQELLVQIDFLNKEIIRVQNQINAILASKGQNNNQSTTCGEFKNDLYFGMRNNSEVSCLQEFLKNQGPEIYPEGLVTGNFLNATRSAVIRFQEKYKDEILKPLGLERGTGFLGLRTRDKINQLLR